MFLGVSLPCLFGMISGVNGMSSCRMSMMGGFLVLPTVVMLGRLAVMPGGVRMMF